MSSTAWIAVDWGTSNVRAWGIAADGASTFAVGSDRGMSRITRADYPAVLSELIGNSLSADARSVPTVICGMAGARQGWIEAPYLSTPANLVELSAGAVHPSDAPSAFAPLILPGVAERIAGHEDVMRGEETQLLGLLGLRPGFEGTVVLPGTHSKWAEIRGGRLVRFGTAMTGELFEVIGTHSVLRHSLAGDRDGPQNAAGFDDGLDAAMARPDALTALLFRTRAAALLSAKGADWCAGYLSGLLVGAEIAAHRDWIDGPLPLIGSTRLCASYQTALKRAGHDSFVIDATEATLAGLKQAWSQIDG